MSSIVKYERFDKDGIELVINTVDGESFATQAGYSRMSGVDYATIRKRVERIKDRDNITFKTAEIQTEQGLRLVTLLTEDIICEWLQKDNPTIATQLLKLGVRVFMHKLAGYEVKSTAVEELSRLQILEMALDSERGRLQAIAEKALVEKQNKMLTDTCVSLKEEIVEKQPLVKLAETLVVNDEKGVTIEEFAKSMKIGRNTMFRKLREINFLQQNGRTPYQTHINLERAEVYRKPRKYQPNIYDTVTVLTGKGQKYIAKKLEELLKKEQTEVFMESYLSTDDF